MTKIIIVEDDQFFCKRLAEIGNDLGLECITVYNVQDALNIDLNIEHKKIQKPIMPTLRIAKPYYINNDFKGMLIINILRKLFKVKIT